MLYTANKQWVTGLKRLSWDDKEYLMVSGDALKIEFFEIFLEKFENVHIGRLGL